MLYLNTYIRHNGQTIEVIIIAIITSKNASFFGNCKGFFTWNLQIYLANLQFYGIDVFFFFNLPSCLVSHFAHLENSFILKELDCVNIHVAVFKFFILLMLLKPVHWQK